MERKLLSKPVIYVSCFLKKNQAEYYDRISEVRRSGNYEQWVRFFLEAVSSAAGDALESVQKNYPRCMITTPHGFLCLHGTRILQ
ncbi:MAG: hypothetical protein PUF35_10990 [Subdoligranulum sp.]|nr:hypothetical protein [Subdoligranulum sp.]